MRRRLINHDTFKEMQDRSCTSAAKELSEVEDILSRAIDVDGLILDSFNDTAVLYETADGTHVHAGYEIDNGYITFNNIEELVINEEEEHLNARGLVEQMVDSLLDGENAKANDVFNQYFELPLTRRTMSEVTITTSMSKPTKRDPKRGKRQSRSDVFKRIRAMKKSIATWNTKKKS